MSETEDEVEDFIKEYLSEDGIAVRYKTLAWVTGSFIIYLYVSAFIIYVPIYLVTNNLLNLPETLLGYENGRFWVLFGFSSFLSIGAYLQIKKRMNELPINEDSIAYHYLASAISRYQDQDFKGSMEYLEEFSDYVGIQNHQILHPEIQMQFYNYIESLSNIESTNILQKEMERTFMENTGKIISEINKANNYELEEVETTETEKSVPSKPIVILEAIFGTMSYNTVKILLGVLAFIGAILIYAVYGAQPTLVYLAAFSVLQFVVSIGK